MSKRNVSEIETGSGFFMGFVNATMDVVREKAIPFAAVYRLATAGGRKTLGSMIDLAYADWQAEQPKPVEQQPQGSRSYQAVPTNGNSPFSAPIVYVQPTFEELKRRFPVYVKPDYEGRRFKPIECCRGVSTESREVAFEYVYGAPYGTSSYVVFNRMDGAGLRPALYEELLCFAKKYPDEQRKYAIVALGSVTDVHGHRSAACLWGGNAGWRLDLRRIDCDWEGESHFLAVRKTLDKMTDLADADAPFRAPVVYVQPSIDELRSQFPAHVHPDYEGRRFDQVRRSSRHVSTESRELAFEYIHMERDASEDEVLTKMYHKGLRPALYEELLCFAKKYPDEQRKYVIAALGSRTDVNRGDRVAYLTSSSEGRQLGLGWSGRCSGSCRFLAVRMTLGARTYLADADQQAEQPNPVEQQQGSQPHRDATTRADAPFKAPIVYIQPAFEELRLRFAIHVDYDYRGKRFDPIECCRGVSTESREVAFEYVHMDRDASSTNEMLAEMERKGLRPALYEELLGFAKKYPDEQQKYQIAALGSVANVHGRRCVASLWGYDFARGLRLRWIDDVWNGRDRFLAVRKNG